MFEVNLSPARTNNEGNNKEGNTKEDSHASNNVDEMCDFLSNRGVASLQSGGQACNTTHHSAVADVDYYATGSS